MSILSTDPVNHRIGRRLAAVRAMEGLIQTEFADRLGITGRAYVNYELGKREIPAAVLTALLNVFGIDPKWILVGPGDEPVFDDDRPKAKLVVESEQAVKQWLARRRKRLSPEIYAKVVRLMYERAILTGEVDSEYLEKIGSIAA